MSLRKMELTLRPSKEKLRLCPIILPIMIPLSILFHRKYWTRSIAEFLTVDFVIRSGKTGWEEEHGHIIEYSLTLDSNPEFTSSVLVAYARAAYRLNGEKNFGCKTVFDIAPAYLSLKSNAELRKEML